MAILLDTFRMYVIKSYNSKFYFCFFDSDSSPQTDNQFKQGVLQVNNIPYTLALSSIYSQGGKDETSMNLDADDNNIVAFKDDKDSFYDCRFRYNGSNYSLFTNSITNTDSCSAVIYFVKYGTKYWCGKQMRGISAPSTPSDGPHYTEVITSPTNNTLGTIKIAEQLNNYGLEFSLTNYADYVTSIGAYIEGHYKPYNPNNPYSNVGDEPDDPGDGDFDYSSDDVPIPDLPKTNVTDSGLVSLFAPDEGQLRQLAKFLWSDNFSLDSFKKIFNNPMDCILGLSILPIHLPHGGAKEITVGNIVSTVSCDVCSEQYVKLNCGSFTFSRSRFTGGYLDNAPYTRCYLYLPFIGTQEINIDEFMGATLGVEYHIDILTGAMFCFVTRNSKLLLTYSGNCAENVPLSANDFTSTISSMLSMATVGAGAIATIATAGAAAPTTAGMASEALGARTASSLIGAGAQGAGAVMNSKPNVSHSGSLGGGAGAMGQLYPYLIFIAPRPDIPTDQNSYTGFPSNKIEKIGNLKGFNVIEAVNLKVEGANDNEMSEIEAILKGGVII